MKILVTNNTFSFTGGTETYAYAIISEFVRRGFEIDAFTTGPVTMVGDKIRELGVQIYQNYPPEKSYDYIMCSHTSTIEHVKKLNGFKIQTCHSIYSPLSRPYPGLDAYVSISKEVKTHLKSKRFDSTLIYNSVDMDRFKPIKPLNHKLKRILSLSHDDIVNNMLSQACQKAGIDFMWRNKCVNPIFNIENEIQDADIIITVGRGVYESMASGRVVLVFDHRRYAGPQAIGDGILTLDNINKSLENNCSGRATKREFTVDSLIEEFKKYNTELGDQMRTYALRNFDIKTNIDKYLSLKQ